MEHVWAFVNSPFGLMFVGTFMLPLLTLVMKKIFEKAPLLQDLYNTYKGPLFDAVKEAERLIPDNTTNSGLRKLDEAFKYVIKIAPDLAKHDPEKVKALLSQAHAEEKKEGAS